MSKTFLTGYAAALAGFSVLTIGCMGDSAEKPVIGVFENTVVESIATKDGITTTVYNKDRSEVLARLVREPQGMTQIDEEQEVERMVIVPTATSHEHVSQTERFSRELSTGFDASNLVSYNHDVNRAWERAVRIREGAVAYGECGSGWSEWVVPDGWWGSCCTEHDNCYGRGGNEADRLACDESLRTCMNNKWAPGNDYYVAVRTFGGSAFSWNDNTNDCSYCGCAGS